MLAEKLCFYLVATLCFTISFIPYQVLLFLFHHFDDERIREKEMKLYRYKIKIISKLMYVYGGQKKNNIPKSYFYSTWIFIMLTQWEYIKMMTVNIRYQQLPHRKYWIDSLPYHRPNGLVTIVIYPKWIGKREKPKIFMELNLTVLQCFTLLKMKWLKYFMFIILWPIQ